MKTLKNASTTLLVPFHVVPRPLVLATSVFGRHAAGDGVKTRPANGAPREVLGLVPRLVETVGPTRPLPGPCPPRPRPASVARPTRLLGVGRVRVVTAPVSSVALAAPRPGLRAAADEVLLFSRVGPLGEPDVVRPALTPIVAVTPPAFGPPLVGLPSAIAVVPGTGRPPTGARRPPSVAGPATQAGRHAVPPRRPRPPRAGVVPRRVVI